MQDLLNRAEKVIDELNQLIEDEKIFLLHDYYPFMMDENDIKDVEEMIEVGQNDRWDEYVEEQKQKRELERIRENRKKYEKLKLAIKEEKDKKPERKKVAYKSLNKPMDYVYSEEEKNKILQQYDSLLKKRISQLQPGSTASMFGHGLMHQAKRELFNKNMYRKMEEAILNNFVWVKNYSGWSRSGLTRN